MPTFSGMTFELLPIFDAMYELYAKPRSFERFNEYLKLLQGNSKDDMELPIGGYNPMAKDHLLQKIDELTALNAEQIIKNTLAGLNGKLRNEHNDQHFKVVPNISDDLHGAWTNRYTTDYDSKFKLNALITRHFCTPIFWTSEQYDEQKIVIRTLEYCYRTFYWFSHPRPQTLGEHVAQEIFVAGQVNTPVNMNPDFKKLDSFYISNKDNTDYLTIFNFLYGDDAMISLGNEPKGIPYEFAGFEYARRQARNAAQKGIKHNA